MGFTYTAIQAVQGWFVKASELPEISTAQTAQNKRFQISNRFMK